MRPPTPSLTPLLLALVAACAPGAARLEEDAQVDPGVAFVEAILASNAEITCSLRGFVAHAGGVVDVPGVPGGLLASNSLEALEQSVAHGHDHIEVDLVETSDGRLVALHDWGQAVERLFAAPPGVRSHAQWQALESRHGLRHLDVDELLTWLGAQSQGLCLVIDVKGDVPAAAAHMATRAPPQVLARIHPQVHDLAAVEPLEALGYAPPWLALYAADLDDAELLAALDAGPRPQAVTVPLGRVGLIDALCARWIPAFAHTVDHGQQAHGLQDRGFFGVFTDRLTPAARDADPFSEDACRVATVSHIGDDLDVGWIIPDVLPWRGPWGAWLRGLPDEGALTLELLDADGHRTRVEATSHDLLTQHPDTLALRVVDGAPARLAWGDWTSTRGGRVQHGCMKSPPDTLLREPLTRAHRMVTFAGRGDGLAGLALTFFNASDTTVRGSLAQWRSEDALEQTVEVAPWSTRVVLAPAVAGRVEATYSGDPVIIQPLWHDALFLHVR